MCDICNTIENSLNGENPFFVKELETGIVVLGWNQHFYGYTIFMCKKHATELYQLDSEFLAKFMSEMVMVSKAVACAFECDKMNYECLGNSDTFAVALVPESRGRFRELREQRERSCMVAA